MDKFYLWGFLSMEEGLFVITRGRERSEAHRWAEQNCGSDVAPVSFLPLNAAKAYTISHPFDWLHTAPLWVQKHEKTVRDSPLRS